MFDITKESALIRAEEKETGRVEAFSDGVFAVAITLLALDLQIPKIGAEATAGKLAAALARQWPAYLSFVTSFFTVLIMWVNHHGLFKMIQKTTSRLLFINGFLLMMTTAVPFSTALVTQYLRTPAAKVACATYAATFVLISISFNALWRLVTGDRALMRASVSELTIERVGRKWRVGPLAYVIAMLLAFVSPYITILFCTGLWIYWSLVTKEF